MLIYTLRAFVPHATSFTNSLSLLKINTHAHSHALPYHAGHSFPVSCRFFLLHFHGRLRADSKCHEPPLPPCVEPGWPS